MEISLGHLIKQSAERLNLCNKEANIMNQLPDVEVIFEFNGTRKSPANDGYRPAHLITDNYLTTGIHHYYGVESVPPNGTVKGTITFLSPESYPHCLWIGKKISIQEGAHVVGYATITNIYNPLLCLESTMKHTSKHRLLGAKGRLLGYS